MSHPVLVRAILGAAGLAGCLALLSGVARGVADGVGLVVAGAML
jgi:hypothetical protein